MSNHERSLIERLAEAENPRNLLDWESQDGYYVTACRITTEDVPDLIDLMRKWSDPNWADDAPVAQIDHEHLELLPITAWRTLADIKADAAVQPIIDMLCELADESTDLDDWTIEELPHVFGKIGESVIEPLTHLATDEHRCDYLRSLAASGLRRVAHYHPDTRDRIVACLTEMMANARHDQIDFNSTLLVELVGLSAAEAAEPIERAFARNLIDVGMMGAWDDVRRDLGVEGLGLEMPDKPHNSLSGMRTRLGFGIFSDPPVFFAGEIDHDAELAYYQRARDEFSKSLEAQQVIERYGDLGWSHLLLEFGINYLYEIVDEMTLESVEEFILDFVPRKVSAEADSATAILDETTLFWLYLDRVHQLPAAKSIIEWLKSSGLAAQLKARMSDASNFGVAKSMFMLGQQAGYDMTSKADVSQFMAAYNRSQTSSHPYAAAPIVREQRVGRNAPCPCGSGRKFKKCCGG